MNDIEARMAALRQRFVASAAQQASALRTALRDGDRDRAMEVAHHVAGASGIFGHPALGELARHLECALDGAADAAHVDRLADDVLAALDQLPGKG